MAKTFKIATIPGDGTGPEVAREALKVLKAAAAKGGFKFEFTEFDFGAARYLRTSETLPDSAIGEFRNFDSLFLGAIGHPDVKPGILETGILLKIRFEKDSRHRWCSLHWFCSRSAGKIAAPASSSARGKNGATVAARRLGQSRAVFEIQLPPLAHSPQSSTAGSAPRLRVGARRNTNG